MVYLAVFIFSVCSSCALTFALRCYALKQGIIDVPNARSSHSLPTPRGGGVAIVLTFLSGLFFLALAGLLPWNLLWLVLGTGGGVALLGFLDDHGHVAARWRLLGHFIAAVWAILWIGGSPPLNMAGVLVDLGLVGHGLAIIYLVWLLNLYNFMDGIDGIASIEAVTVCGSGALLYYCLGMPALMLVPLLLGAAVLGFLYWNFPPARIFMGDAGSGFLGVMLGVLSLQAAWISPSLFWAWLILLAVFITDASVTLLHRLIRGERVYEAHRTHAYQYASRRFGRHLPVTLSVLVINLFWLLPWALAVGVWEFDGLTGLAIAYAPLVFLAIKFKAGTREQPQT